MLRQPRPLVPHSFGMNLPLNLRAGLVGYWKLDEGSWSGAAGEVIDSSGQGNHETAINGASISSSPAKFGNAGHFDHVSDQYIDCGHGASLFPSSQVTLAAWVYPTNLSLNMVVGGPYYPNGADSYLLYVGQDAGNGKLGWVIEQANGIKVFFLPSSGAALSANIWQHVAGVADGTNLHIYLNGVDCGSSTSYDGSLKGYAGTNFFIGHLGLFANYDWLGYLDDVRVYNRGLSASEMLQLYQFSA